MREFPMPLIWCDGAWIDRGEMIISPDDRGWTHGLGLFETLLAVDGSPVFLERHIGRLSASCAAYGWEVDFDFAGPVIQELLHRSKLVSGRAKVRLAVSGGVGELREPGIGSSRRIWLAASALEERQQPLCVGISRWKRNAESPLAGHKSASYAENLFLLKEARDNGWHEVLVFNHQENLCEAATANILVASGDSLVTPPLSSGCLPGIARGCFLEAGERGLLEISERNISLVELHEADAIFLTSSIRGSVPVTLLDGRGVGRSRQAELLDEIWERLVTENMV